MLTLAPYHVLLYGTLLGTELYQVWTTPTIPPMTSRIGSLHLPELS